MKQNHPQIPLAHRKDFIDSVEKGEYIKAYLYTKRYPPLQNTSYYTQLEEEFEKLTTRVFKLIINNETEQLRQLLSPYIRVPVKQALISFILRFPTEFAAFYTACITNKYKTVSEYIHKHPVLQECYKFKKLSTYVAQECKSIEVLLNNSNIDDALKKLNSIANFTDDGTIARLFEYASLLQNLLQAYEKDNFVLCYEIIDSATNPSLQHNELVKILQAYWEKTLITCKAYAQKGDMKALKAKIALFLDVKTKQKEINSLFQSCFHSKIANLIKTNNPKLAESLIYAYIDKYGKDSKLQILIESYQKTYKKTVAITI